MPFFTKIVEGDWNSVTTRITLYAAKPLQEDSRGRRIFGRDEKRVVGP